MPNLKVANFNVRNLVPASSKDGYHFFYQADQRNCYWNEGEKRDNRYRQKVAWLAAQLDRLKADIVVFQEVFDLQPLQHVIDKSGYRGKVRLLQAGETEFETVDYEGLPARLYRLPRIAVMVPKQWKIVDFTALTQFPSDMNFAREINESGRSWQLNLTEGGESYRSFSRPLLRLRIELPAQYDTAGNSTVMTIFGAHLKSKRPIEARTQTDEPAKQVTEALLERALGQTRSLLVRGLEAAAARAYTLREMASHPERPVLLVGDLNDGPRSVTTDVSGGLGGMAIRSHHHEDREVRSEMRRHAADQQLYSAFDLHTRNAHRDVYYSHIYRRHYDLLDHILLSHHFVPKWARDKHGSPNIASLGSLQVYNDHLVDPELDNLRSDEVGKYLHTRSDHGQLVVRLDWND